jgi:hypothetical protein
VMDFQQSNELAELMRYHEKWSTISAKAGKAPRDEPDWEDGRLWFRDGYPHPDWSAFVIEPKEEGFEVYRASTERRVDPVLSLQGYFSRLDVAGKFIIAKIGNYLRINSRLDPISWQWEDAGLAPEVEELIYSDREVTYRLRNDPATYCIMALGDRPYSHILPLTYGRLTRELLHGFPVDVISVADQV